MPTITADALRAELMQLVQAGQAYQFLTRAQPYLEARADDHQLRLLAARTYLELGLVQSARELVSQAGGSVPLPPECTDIAARLQMLPGASIPWEQSAARFEANLAALPPESAEPIRAAWQAQRARFELYRDRHGCFQVRRRVSSAVWRWVPYLGDQRALDEARPWPTEIEANWPGPYLFEGWAQGHYFERVYHKTRNSFLNYSCPLYVAEVDAAGLAVALHLRDWQELLADPRVVVRAGPDCLAELEALWQRRCNLTRPREVITVGRLDPESSFGTLDFLRQSWTRHEADIEASLSELNRQYAGRDLAYWARRFEQVRAGEGKPLRIISAVSRQTTFLKHSLRDAQRAFEALGHTCTVVTEETDYEALSSLTYHRVVRELDPDVILVLDHLRAEYPSLVPDNLPVLTWDQDQLPCACAAENLRGVAPHDFIVGYSKSAFVRAGCNPAQYRYARVPTCPEQFSGDPLTPAEVERYTCDVSFVSHASQTPREFHQEERGRHDDPAVWKLLDTLFELLPAELAEHRVVNGQIALKVLEEAERTLGVQVTDEGWRARLLSWYLWRLGDRIFRHEALEWVAQWSRRQGRTLRIYGNGWDRHPTLSEYAAGPVENGRELLCVYRASKINLQLMPAGFIHQRALDGLAAGGFFLTRLAPNDTRGKLLHRFVQRVRELGIETTAELRASKDEALQADFRAYFGPWVSRWDPDNPALLNDTLISAELPYPDEVFPDFDEITFDGAEEFATKAERFLGDEQLRATMTERMRNVVVERFTYRAAMAQFLEAMSDYLTKAVAATQT